MISLPAVLQGMTRASIRLIWLGLVDQRWKREKPRDRYICLDGYRSLTDGGLQRQFLIFFWFVGVGRSEMQDGRAFLRKWGLGLRRWFAKSHISIYSREKSNLGSTDKK